MFFSNAVFPLRRALEKGLHVGLGTDISGGPAASLVDTARMTVTASRMLEEGVDASLPAGSRGVESSRVDFRTAFWLASMGGAQALGLPVGCFAPGRQFDAMLVRLPEDHLLDIGSKSDDLLQKIIMLATPEHIQQTWVAGKSVHQRD